MDYLNKIIIGTWSLSGDFGNVSLNNIEQVLTYCYEKGLKEFDTAPNYGNGFMEFALGKIFHSKKDVVINTKAGNRPFIGKSFSVDDIKRSVEDSLKRLNIEKINILYLHNPRTEVRNYIPLVRCLNDFVSEGLINYTGLSCAKNFDYPDEVLGAFNYIQNDVNPLFVDPIEREYPNGTKLIARSPMASGILSGKLNKNTVFPADDHRSGWLKGERLGSILKRVDRLANINLDLTVPEIAKQFVLKSSKIDKVIFGVKRIEHVDMLLSGNSRFSLSDEMVTKIIEMYNDDYGLQNEGHLKY